MSTKALFVFVDLVLVPRTFSMACHHHWFLVQGVVSPAQHHKPHWRFCWGCPGFWPHRCPQSPGSYQIKKCKELHTLTNSGLHRPELDKGTLIFVKYGGAHTHISLASIMCMGSIQFDTNWLSCMMHSRKCRLWQVPELAPCWTGINLNYIITWS